VKNFSNNVLTPPIKAGDVQASHQSRLHDRKNFRISLKQWRMLHAVIDCGGYTDAAKHLNLSQSALSYTITKLQQQLGIPLLKIEGRKAHLTDAGRALLEGSRHLIREALELEEFAENMRQGLGREIRLVVDHNFPAHLLTLALRNFSIIDASVKIRLEEVSMCQVKKALFQQTADMAIAGEVPNGFLGDPLIELEYVAVAHPDHPLFALGRTVMADDLKRQVEVVICDSGGMESKIPKHFPGGQVCRWSVNSVDTALKVLSERLGYAWLSRHRIRSWLDQGLLKVLPLSEGRVYTNTLYLIHGRSRERGTCADRLAEVLHRLAAMDSMQSSPARPEAVWGQVVTPDKLRLP
jgi:DNA-binding transcriptional LysR family regulator